MSETSPSPTLLQMTTAIVSAHVTNNAVPVAELPGLISTVYHALSQPPQPSNSAAAASRPEPAVPIKKSVFPDYIVCLEDGVKLKVLKRHLAGLGITPEEYRERWGLRADYPMVAPNYARKRSELAKGAGLGLKVVSDAV